jgi:GT2 family glycosyltransferase
MPRVAIEHVDAACMPPVLARQEADSRLIFWWQDVPVGEAEDHGTPGEPIDLARYWSAIEATPALVWAKHVASRGTSPSLGASLVICTRDRPDELRRCLNSLAAQTYSPVEVIVVDNAPRDTRARQVAEIAGVKYVREDRPGLSHARNCGLRHADADVIAFTDDDVILHPRWLERLVLALQESDALAVTGLVLPAELDTEAQQHFETHWGFGQGYEPLVFGQDFFAADRTTGCEVWNIGAGASMAFRRQAFEKAGNFDVRLGAGMAGCSEDSEFWHRILSIGGTCRYEPAAVAFHHHRRDMGSLGHQIYQYMKGHAAALMVQYERSGNRGNLWRALYFLPRDNAARVWRRMRYGARPGDRFLWREVAGLLAGLGYYLRHSRAE